MINDKQEVDKLVDEGRYQEAAERAREGRDFARAAELFERIWDFASAATMAEEDGDLARALANALEAKDKTLAERHAAAMQALGDKGARDAMEVFVKHRHFASAARLAESLDELEHAVDYYQEGHLDIEAARILVKLGRDRDAGRILERALRDAEPGADQSSANLELGLIFARLLQHESAVRCLQVSTEHPDTRSKANRALVTELAALGLRDAARDLLAKVRREDSSVSPNLDAFLRAERKPVTRKNALKEARLIGGRYRLDRLLGSGGSGRVYLAKDVVSEQELAIKLLANTHARNSDGYLRFAREAKLAKNLRHANLIEVYDFSADLGFLVMEYMRGGSLEDKIKAEIAPAAVRRFCLDVLSGLEMAHQRGIIHRDIKPANIFFDARGTAKIGDFGVAHLQDLGQTQTGGLIGTLAYMSPEQITGAPLTIASDLYGLGITLFEALAGRLPFQGPDFVAQHLGEDVPLPSEVSTCDASWDPVVLKLLAKNPGDRYDSIASLRRDLHALQLGDESKPLMMPKASPSTSAGSSIRMAAAAPAEKESDDDEKPRYAFETSIGSTPHSKLSRAIDTVLNRSVIFERFSEALGEERERRLYALTRGGGPFLQRALAYDRKTAVAIFEAPTGMPMADLDEPLSTRLATRLLKRLAQAIAPLHENDRAHGSLSGGTILLDDRGHPTVLVCGLEAPAAPPSPSRDVEEIMKVVADAVGPEDDSESPEEGAENPDKGEESPEEGAESPEESSENPDDDSENPDDDQEPTVPAAEILLNRLLENPGQETRARLLALPLSDGEELHRFAEAIELVLLEHKQGA